MKTTVEIPDRLFLAAKKKAVESRTTLRALLERALRRELAEGRRVPKTRKPRRSTIRWRTDPGGLPPGLDVSDRAAMHEWLRR